MKKMPVSTNFNTTDATIAETLDLKKQADRIIQNATHKSAILVLGPSGVGKTPFTKLMTQDNSKLTSIRNKKQGAYLMEDTDNTIGTSTLLSKTIFPTLYVNTSINAAFYDMPGFYDTRRVAYGITTTYAIKAIVNKLEKIKMIFLIGYDQVTPSTGNRNGFTDLLKSISEFVTDIDKFRSSIGLVVSKVPKTNGNGEHISDQEVIESVVDFVKQEVVPVLENNATEINLSSDDRRRALKFIYIILEERDRDYPRIGLFRYADEPGPYSNISLVQRAKVRVEKMIYETLNFTTTSENDFAYAISEESLININNISQIIKNDIDSHIGVIVKNMEQFFLTKEKTTGNLKTLYDEINSKHDNLSKVQIEAKNATYSRCVELVEENAAYNFTDVASTSTIRSHLKFLEFLLIYDKISRSNSFECFHGLNVMIDYLHDSREWYRFVLNLYDNLSTYEIQKNITSCKNAATNFRQSTGDKVPAAVQAFLQQCSTTVYEHENDRIKNIKLNEFKLKALNNVLDYTLQHESHQSCDADTPNKLVVKGRFVCFSNIVHTSKRCSKTIDIVQVFASNKVFFDKSLNKSGENFQLSIIAPIWHIHHDSQIILDGLPKNAHNKTDADDGFAPGGSGTDGVVGLPGNSAGIFIGVGETFINAHKLHISANGGTGGPGQRGGNGIDGKDGTEPSSNVLQCEKDKCDDCYAKKLVNGKITRITTEDEPIVVPRSTVVSHRVKTSIFFHAYGENCTCGGNGGHGGSGGYGGSAGVFFIPINATNFPTISNSTGRRGSDGIGGAGGVSGKVGKSVSTKHILTQSAQAAFFTDRKVGDCITSMEVVNIYDLPLCRNGTAGITGHVKPTNKSETISFFNVIPATINDYKAYLRGTAFAPSSPINESQLKFFYNSLENKTYDYYDTSAFVNELYGLERQFDTLHETISFLPFYKSLIDRIGKYERKKSVHDQVPLHYLNTAVLSKICAMNNHLQDYLIIDVHKYLQNAKEDIDTYKKELREVNINHHTEQFKSTIYAQITRATALITEQILPEVEEIILQTDNAMRSLVEEIKNLEKKAKEHEAELKAKREQLRRQLVTRNVLGYIQIASACLAFVGPVGAIAAAVTGAVGGAYQSFILDNTPLTTTIGKQATKITELLKIRQQNLKDRLGKAERKLEEFSNENPTISGDFGNLKKIFNANYQLLDKEMKTGADLDPESVDRRAILHANLTNTVEEMKKRQFQQDVDINKRLNILTYVANLVTVGEVAANVFSGIKKHESEIEQLDNEAKNAHDYTSLLGDYEQNMYNTMVPMVKDVTKYFNSSSESHVQLDVSKWKLQSKVKNLNFQVERMTRGLANTEGITSQEYLKHYIQQFEDAMNAINQIYHRVQDYQDQLKLIEYISKLGSEEAKLTNDQQLSNDVDKLKLIIRSNLVMEAYKKGINAFKQYVFPFAYLYAQTFELSYASRQSTNITLLAHDAANQIKTLQDELDKDETEIKNHYQKFVFPDNEFLFYNYTRKENIIKLLQGREITLTAKQTSNVNAVRFNEIGIGFKCADDAIVSDLNTLLTQFIVVMTHLGDSYYKFNDTLYLIPHEEVTVIHSVNKNNATYTHENQPYKKIKNNKPLLSPYATWKIILEHKRDDHETDNDFSSTLNFTHRLNRTDDAINLTLEGRGSYVRKTAPISYADVDKFYKADAAKRIATAEDGISNRRKRQVTNNNYKDAVIDDILASNSASASSSLKPFGYNAINWIKDNVSRLKNVLTKRIENYWFKNDCNYVEQFKTLDCNIFHNVLIVESNQQGIEVLEIEHEKNVNNNRVINFSGYNQGNLLLLELLLHKKNGMKFNERNFDLMVNNYDENFENRMDAQNMAYSAHVAKNVKLLQVF